jgi:hypothetical protein
VNNRLPNLPENQLITRLQGIDTTLKELRTSQRVSGSGGTLNYLSKTNNTWDFTETVGANDGATHQAIFTVTFTADGTQRFPTQMCLFDIFINSATITTGPIEANRLSPQSDTWTDGTRTVLLIQSGLYTNNAVERYAQSNSAYYTDPLVWQWKIGISTFSAQFTYWMKAGSLGSSPGTLSVTRVLT